MPSHQAPQQGRAPQRQPGDRPERPAVPASTYRLQLGAGMTFGDAAELASYLDDLGAGALYASPMLAAAPGSTHGYDVVDPSRASEALGGEGARAALAARLRELGLGLVADLVPNHMGVQAPRANSWWWDVLRNGRRSAYAGHFDIDWDQGPILLPVLGDGPVTLELDGDVLRYGELELPVADGTGAGTPEQVHARQHYRLVHWRRGAAELTYRRFFDVSTLAAVRVEDPAVFDDVHAEVLRWVRAGEVTGLRVDHPDGLSCPGAYLRRLRAEAPDAWILVEKILGAGESLPASWPVDGTTGYDALREVCGVFVDPAGARPLTALYADVAEVPHAAASDISVVEGSCRRLVAHTMLRAEVRRIARLLHDPGTWTRPNTWMAGAGAGGWAAGLSPAEHGIGVERAEAAVTELLCSYGVYRSYLPEGLEAAERAFTAAQQSRPDLATVLEVMAAEVFGNPTGQLATRLQQTSGMVMAKGVEDTAFYRYNRFIALNEVGGAPDHFGVGLEEFHAAAAARDAGWPATMTTLSTHDTKRSEDVRARLAAVTEVAPQFAARMRRWAMRRGLPEPTLDLLAWQTLVGAWPIETARMRDYLRKASKEAKVRTTWDDPDPEFDDAVESWPAQVATDPALSADVGAFVLAVRAAGWSNSLGQKLLQLAGPGVPDVYQGTELWDNSLVDPDNRRPVDFALRRELLARLDTGWLPPVDETGTSKLLVVSRTLRLRRSQPELFRGYRPLRAEGPAAAHAVAFARGPRRSLVAVATRLPIGLTTAGGWRDTTLPLPGGPGTWTDALTGAPVTNGAPALADLLCRYPVALLLRSP
jgi:(1->4)-alpha-D-glucan 1-alpha-D-glucosylmutase